MSKEFKNIDELFQSTFEGDTTEVPAFVKVNIDKHIDAGSKKAGWWISGGIVTLLILITSLFIFNSEEKLNKNDLTNADSNQPNSNFTQQNTLIDDTNSNSTNIDHTTETNQLNSVSTNHSTASNNWNTSSESNSNSAQITDNDKEFLVDAGSDKTEPDQSQKTVGEYTGEKDLESNSSLEITNKFHPKMNYSISPIASRMNIKTNFITNQFTPLKSFSLVPVMAPSTELNAKKVANTITKKEVYNPWMISMYGGTSLVRSAYSSNNSTEVDLYKNSTNDKLGIEATAEVTYCFKNGILFGSGLAYSKLSQDYTYFKEQINIDSTITWTYQDIYEYDSLLDTTIFVGIDSISTTNYDSSSVTLYDQTGQTQASYIHLPFKIGAQLEKNQWRYEFFLAGRFNYLISASGGYIVNDAYTGFTKNSGQIFKPWYIDLMLGTAVHYQLTDHLYVSGTLRYCPALNKIYEGVSFNRSIQSAQLGIGLSWKL